MLENFIYAKQKSLFEEALNNGEVLNEAIVFIEDTKEIWNHGTYFDGSAVDLSNIETSILNILDTKADKTEIPTKVSELENDVPYVIDYTIPQGVSIMDASGNIMTAEEWSEDKGLTGLVVSDGEHEYVVAALDDYPQKNWSTAISSINIEGITDDNNTGYRFEDYNATSNTNAVLETLALNNASEEDNAFTYARNFSNGIYKAGEWDVPSGAYIMDFFRLVLEEQSEDGPISNLLKIIGKENIKDLLLGGSGYVITSSEWSDANAVHLGLYNHNLIANPKSNNVYVIPIHVITPDEFPTLKEKVETLESKVADTEPYILDYNYSWANTETTLTDWNDKFNELFDVISNNKPIVVNYNSTYYTPIASSGERPTYDLSIIGISFEHIETSYDTLKVDKKVHDITFLKDSFGITVKDVSGNELAYKSDIPTKVSEFENDVPYAVDSVKYIPQGVSIMDGNGNIITDPSLWSEDLGLTGIVVSNGEHEIVLGLFSTEEEATSTPWSEAALINTDVEGVVNYENENFTGYESTSNTDAIIAALATSSNPDETNNAAVKCRNFSSGIYGAGEWDLPALRHCGIFYWASEYYESIKNVATYVGKYLFDHNNVLLCSTEYDTNNFAGTQPRFAYISGFPKSVTGYVLVPIHVITPEEKGVSLNDRVTSLEEINNSELYIFNYLYSWENNTTTLTDWSDNFDELKEAIINKKRILVDIADYPEYSLHYEPFIHYEYNNFKGDFIYLTFNLVDFENLHYGVGINNTFIVSKCVQIFKNSDNVVYIEDKTWNPEDKIPTKVSELKNDSNYLITESDPVFTASAASGITSENISDWNNKLNKNLYFNNLTASSWIEDATYADYPYRCDLACSGVTGSDYAEVTYNVAEAISGDYAPICETDLDVVKIWSKKNDSIVIPTVIVTMI